MSNCDLNIFFTSTPTPAVQSEDLLKAVNYALNGVLNTKLSNCYTSLFFNQKQILHSNSKKKYSNVRSENIILGEMVSGFWNRAAVSSISLLTKHFFPCYLIPQMFFNYIFNGKPRCNFSLVKEFFMKLLLSYPPIPNRTNYYTEILCGKYITINERRRKNKKLMLSVIKMLINLLKVPEEFQFECDIDIIQEPQIVQVTNLNDIFLYCSRLNLLKKETLTSYNELSWSEKMKRCSIALKIICEILETNFILCCENSTSNNSLILKILWPDIKKIGILNKKVNKVLNLYRLSLQLGESNFHLIKTISNLINLIGETIREFDKNEGIKYPYFGTKTSNFARELSYGLSEYFEEFGETSELILSLMPPWLRLLFCAHLLNFFTEYQCSPELLGVYDILEFMTTIEIKSKDQPSECQASINEKILRKLKKLKSINGRNARGEAPLQRACRKNKSEKVKALLTFPELDVNGTDDGGWTALHFAAFNGHVNCVEELLKFHPKEGLQKPVNTRARGPSNTTPLMCAVSQGHPEVCRLLLDHSGSVLLEDITESNQTALELSDNPEIRKILKYYKRNNINGQEKNNNINIKEEYKESVSRICVEMIQAYLSTYRTWDVYKKRRKLKENSDENFLSAEVIPTIDYTRYQRDKKNIRKLKRLIPKLEGVKEFSSCFQFYTELLNSNK